MAAPFASLLLLASIQMALRFALGDVGEQPDTVTVTVINIISLIIGYVSLVGMLGFPVWVVMLVIALNHNSKLAKAKRK